MMGKRQTREAKLFYTDVNIEERMPMNHPLRQIACAVDFSFVRKEVAHLYGVNGHESLDPTLILKLSFLCFYQNIRSERELMRQLPLQIDWLWFCELDLDSEIPNHSVLSKARKLWGEAVFTKFFDHVLVRCQDAGLVGGQGVFEETPRERLSEGLVAEAIAGGLYRVSRVVSSWPSQEPRGGRLCRGSCADGSSSLSLAEA